MLKASVELIFLSYFRTVLRVGEGGGGGFPLKRAKPICRLKAKVASGSIIIRYGSIIRDLAEFVKIRHGST